MKDVFKSPPSSWPSPPGEGKGRGHAWICGAALRLIQPFAFIHTAFCNNLSWHFPICKKVRCARRIFKLENYLDQILTSVSGGMSAEKNHLCPGSGIIFFLALPLVWAGVPQPAAAAEPRIVTIYNFVRDSDYRIPDSKAALYEATAQELEVVKRVKAPATFALQYDALMDTNYQNLFKAKLGAEDEIAAWWEIPEELVERAGLKWRGRHEWDPEADVGFSPGYTPDERRRLVDAYMADFKGIFGYYPRTVGSWYIDEVTLEYMARKYGIVASCNCKDQIGTDFYTLWGGYWNQAYYPSRLDAYMPAQTKAGQIDVPIFRMLGSDPIYQGYSAGMWTLEPVYPAAGGSAGWVGWYLNNLIHEPCLAFGYAQAGQENSFGWEAMKAGLTEQVSVLSKLAKAGEIQVETLAQAGQWFRRYYSLTPPTAVVALDDWKHEGRKAVWYDSRYYRVNVFWQNGVFFIRDLHCFDESVVSPTHSTALTNTSLAYETLPVMDCASWRGAGTKALGMWPVLLDADDTTSPMTAEGPPVVKELDAKELSIEQSLTGGGRFSIVCGEKSITCAGVNGQGQPLHWAWDLVGGDGQKAVVRAVTVEGIKYKFAGTDYELRLPPESGSCRKMGNDEIRVSADGSGKLVLNLGQH